MPPRPKPWHAHLTIDLLAHVVNNSLLHPFIAWLIPLSLRAVTRPYDSLDFLLACVWAAFVTVLAVLGVINKRVAYGVPREVDWAEEVVVVTGGASGLGRVLTAMYAMRGASVAALDVRLPEESRGLAGKAKEDWDVEEVEGVRFYRSDVSDPQAVETVRDRIEKDLGPPTILINNAAILHGRPFVSLSPADLQRSISINLLGPMYTLRNFLPHMLSASAEGRIPGATIVTVASVLGKLGARNLSDYTAAKAGLIALHRSLCAELSGPRGNEHGMMAGAEHVRAVLVTPGQLGTGMFAAVKTPNQFLGPVVEPVELAREIVKVVDSGFGGEISLPLYARWIEWMGVLPVGLQRVVRWMSGVDAAMDGFGVTGDRGKDGHSSDENGKRQQREKIQ